MQVQAARNFKAWSTSKQAAAQEAWARKQEAELVRSWNRQLQRCMCVGTQIAPGTSPSQLHYAPPPAPRTHAHSRLHSGSPPPGRPALFH